MKLEDLLKKWRKSCVEPAWKIIGGLEPVSPH